MKKYTGKRKQKNLIIENQENIEKKKEKEKMKETKKEKSSSTIIKNAWRDYESCFFFKDLFRSDFCNIAIIDIYPNRHHHLF